MTDRRYPNAPVRLGWRYPPARRLGGNVCSGEQGMSQSPKTSAKSVTKLVRPSNRAQAAAQVRKQEQRQHLMVWFGVGLVIALAAASVLY